jgi:hypothetical protein
MNRQEQELRLVIREMINEASLGDTVARAATGAVAAAKAAFEDLKDSGGQYVYRVFPNGTLQIIKSPAKNSKASPQNPLTVTAKNQYYKTIIGDLKSANPSSQTLASRVFNTITAAASSAAKTAADALSTGQGTAPAQAAPPTAVGPSDVAGVSMYGAKIGESNNYTEYRIYSNGMIKRFGVMRNGQWTMDDPAKEIPATQRQKLASTILAADQYDSSAKESLDGIVSGKLTGANAQDASAMNSFLSVMRKTLLSAGAPIAYVAFADYLLGRTTAWTTNDLPAQYQADLAKVAKYALTRKSPKTGKRGEILHDNPFVYNDFWRNASVKLGQGVPGTPLDGQGMKGDGTVEALEFFLGGMVVTQQGQNYVIDDIYDYDDYYVSPKAYDEMSEFLGRLAKAGSLYDFVRKAAAFRQSTGYTGFPVKIVLPVSLAADFKV